MSPKTPSCPSWTAKITLMSYSVLALPPFQKRLDSGFHILRIECLILINEAKSEALLFAHRLLPFGRIVIHNSVVMVFVSLVVMVAMRTKRNQKHIGSHPQPRNHLTPHPCKAHQINPQPTFKMDIRPLRRLEPVDTVFECQKCMAIPCLCDAVPAIRSMLTTQPTPP